MNLGFARGIIAPTDTAHRIPPSATASGGDDQKRTVDVAQAFANGADYIVVGRPIRDAADPRAAAEAIQDSIKKIKG